MINMSLTICDILLQFLKLFGDSGIAPDVKQDDQLEFQGRLEHHDDQNSAKQFLISSYKRNLYPALKAEIRQNFQDPIHSGTSGSRSKRNFHSCNGLGWIFAVYCSYSWTLRAVQFSVWVRVHIIKDDGYYVNYADCGNQWATSWWEQFKVLLRRGLRERKHESYSGLRIFQVLSVSILSGLMWWHSDNSHVQDQV